MIDTSDFVLRFYGSILVGLILLGVAASVRIRSVVLDADPLIRVSLPIFPFISIPVQVRKLVRHPWILRCGIAMLGLGFLAVGLGMDFSKVFPREMAVSVFFDVEGLRATLDEFSDSDRSALGISSEWDTTTAAYDADVKERLGELWAADRSHDVADTAYVDRQHISASGRTSFEVSRESLLKYRILSSGGHLDHRIGMPGVPPIGYRTTFELRPSRFNTFRPSVRSVVSGGVLLRPEFDQVLAQTDNIGEALPIDYIIIGATKVRLFPVPDFGDTIYFVRKEDGSLVPVAYAQYNMRYVE